MLEVNDLMQLSPICICVFMLMSSLFNGDVKAILWVTGLIVGMVLLLPLDGFFQPNTASACAATAQPVLQLFSNYKNISITTFIIMYTFTYLLLPMQRAGDWNYFVLFGFLAMLIMDTVFKLYSMCMTKLQWFVGCVLGIMYGFAYFAVIQSAGGDKMLYFNTVTSNDVYCTRPKKQQFKCYVYKNGEIISSI